MYEIAMMCRRNLCFVACVFAIVTVALCTDVTNIVLQEDVDSDVEYLVEEMNSTEINYVLTQATESQFIFVKVPIVYAFG